LHSAIPFFFHQQQLPCAFTSSVRRRIDFMSSSLDAVRCTLHHGAMWMHLDNVSVEIRPQLLEKSPILMNALSAAHPSLARKVTVAAPREWLQSWAACYCNEEQSLSNVDVKDLVKCLLVCPLLWNMLSIVLKKPLLPLLCLCMYVCITAHGKPGSTVPLIPIISSLFNSLRTS
jgi:hypothetical protein